MLIHIPSYIKQLLPPTWRTPKQEGIVEVLFQPVQAVLDRYYSYRTDVLFRAGLTGQKLLLEYYLQNSVDGRIFLMESDNNNVDFVVVVPAALTATQRKQVTDIVQQYKLPSKRFSLKDIGTATGVVVVDPPTVALAWTSSYPKYIAGVGLFLAINQSGSYATRIKRNGSIVLDSAKTYAADVALNLGTWQSGTYTIEVGALSATLTISDSYAITINIIEKIPTETNGAWRAVFSETEKGIRNITAKWYKNGVEISSYDIPNLNTNQVSYIYFIPKNEEPWHVKSNGAGTYTMRLQTSIGGNVYYDEEQVTFTNDDLGIIVDGGGDGGDGGGDTGGGATSSNTDYTIQGWSAPTDPNSDVDITVDMQNIVFKARLLGGDGTYNCIAKYAGMTVLSAQATHAGHITLNLPALYQGMDLAGKTLNFEFQKQGGSTQLLNYFVPVLVRFAFTPDPNYSDDATIHIRYRKPFDSALYILQDIAGSFGFGGSHIWLNGGAATISGQKNTTVLPVTPVPPYRHINILKMFYDSRISNVNATGWMMFYGSDLYNVKVAQIDFYIKTAL